MDLNKNSYIYTYAAVMVIGVAAVLAILSVALKPAQQANIKTEKQQNILAAVDIHVENKSQTEAKFKELVTESYLVDNTGTKVDGKAFDVDMKKLKAKAPKLQQLPVYEYKGKDGSTKYILPLYGKGLWGPIWGFMSINDDFNTIYGAIFDHKAETPGLGAEIASSDFQKQFKGKKIFDNNLKFKSITVAKASENVEEQFKVDGISGGTITSKGLQKMIYDNLTLYQPFFNSKRQ